MVATVRGTYAVRTGWIRVRAYCLRHLARTGRRIQRLGLPRAVESLRHAPACAAVLLNPGDRSFPRASLAHAFTVTGTCMTAVIDEATALSITASRCTSLRFVCSRFVTILHHTCPTRRSRIRNSCRSILYLHGVHAQGEDERGSTSLGAHCQAELKLSSSSPLGRKINI
jgi:hypothetical protein